MYAYTPCVCLTPTVFGTRVIGSFLASSETGFYAGVANFNTDEPLSSFFTLE